MIIKNNFNDRSANPLDDYSSIGKGSHSLDKEFEMERAMLDIRKRYGANAIFKGRNLEKASTALERNGQVGGHKA